MWGDSIFRVTPQQKTNVERLEQAIHDRFLQMTADRGVIEVKRILQSGAFKHPTGALTNSIQGRVEGNAVIWWSDLEYALPQEAGVRPHQMWYLLGKTVPLTIYKHGGKITIFRKVTMKSLLAGKWFHPGYPGKNFMKRGIETTVAAIPQILQDARTAIIQMGV